MTVPPPRESSKRGVARRVGSGAGWIVAVGCLVGGAVLLFIEDKTGLPTMGPGVALVGCAFLLGGLDSVIRRRHVSGKVQAFTQVEYIGGSAVAWGVAFSLVGVALVGAGLVKTLGAADFVLGLLQRRPGLAIAWAGLVLASIGRGLMGRWRRAGGGQASTLTLLPARLGGAALLLLGAVLVAVGALEIVFPAVFDAGVARLIDVVPRPPALPDPPRRPRSS